MEEDIKLVEKFIEYSNYEGYIDFNDYISNRDIEAIENILKEIKRLQVYDNIEYQKYLYGNIEQNYISKSKIYSEIAKLEATEGLEDDIIAQYLKRLLKEG